MLFCRATALYEAIQVANNVAFVYYNNGSIRETYSSTLPDMLTLGWQSAALLTIKMLLYYILRQLK